MTRDSFLGKCSSKGAHLNWGKHWGKPWSEKGSIPGVRAGAEKRSIDKSSAVHHRFNKKKRPGIRGQEVQDGRCDRATHDEQQAGTTLGRHHQWSGQQSTQLMDGTCRKKQLLQEQSTSKVGACVKQSWGKLEAYKNIARWAHKKGEHRQEGCTTHKAALLPLHTAVRATPGAPGLPCRERDGPMQGRFVSLGTYKPVSEPAAAYPPGPP